MSTYEDGYLQALMDVKATVHTLVNEPSIPNDGKLELLGVVSILEAMIRVTIEHPTDPGGHDLTE